MTTPKRTYGIFSLNFLGATTKEVGEIGWIHDVKWAFNPGSRTERLFTPDLAPLVFGASDSDGLKLEVSPRMEGAHLPGVLLPTTLRGDLKLSENGSVHFSTRVSQEALEQAGFTPAVWFEASFALECTVSDQPTLEEQTEAQIQAELGALPLFGTGEGQALPEVNTDEVLTEMSEAPDGPPMTDTGAPPSITLDPKADGEDLPFPLDDGAAD